MPAGLVAVLLAGTTGALVLRRPSEAVSDQPAPTAVVVEREFTPRVLATGNISLLPGARIEVGARVSGVVVSLPVTKGSRVERGAIIARLDDREARARLAQTEATLAELEATLRQLTEDLARAETLVRAQATTTQQAESARTAVSTAQARVAAARAARELAQLQLDYTVIRAPIAGVVASITTQEGETVAASLAAPTFVTLLDPRRIECIALVDEVDIGRVHVGDTAEFTVDAYPGRVFRGQVVNIAPDATILGGVIDYEVRVRILDDAGDLKPQMTASVSIAGASTRTLVIPTSAIRQSELGAYVWRLRNGSAQRTSVVLGARQSDFSQLRSGLSKGDTILTGNFPEGR